MDVRAKDPGLRLIELIREVLRPSASGQKGALVRPLLFFASSDPMLANMLFGTNPPAPILTPCIGICTLAANGLCEGCWRTGDEIAAWRTLDDEERRRIMEDVLPAREAACR